MSWEEGPRTRKRGVATRGATLADKNTSFSRESRFEKEHLKTEFTDALLVRFAALRALGSFMFLAFGDPLVNVRPAFHAFSDLLESMSWRETISFYVVQIQFIQDRPNGLSDIILIRYVLERDFNPIEPSTQAFYFSRIEQVDGVIEQEVIDGACYAHGVVVQLRFLETAVTEEVLEIQHECLVLVVKPDKIS